MAYINRNGPDFFLSSSKLWGQDLFLEKIPNVQIRWSHRPLQIPLQRNDARRKFLLQLWHWNCAVWGRSPNLLEPNTVKVFFFREPFQFRVKENFPHRNITPSGDGYSTPILLKKQRSKNPKYGKGTPYKVKPRSSPKNCYDWKRSEWLDTISLVTSEISFFLSLKQMTQKTRGKNYYCSSVATWVVIFRIWIYDNLLLTQTSERNLQKWCWHVCH